MPDSAPAPQQQVPEQAAAILASLKADFDAAAQDARDDGKVWKWLRHYDAPKTREEEFTGYAEKAVKAANLFGKDNAAAATELQALKKSFDAIAADCRAAPMDFLESCFGLSAQEAAKFEDFSTRVSSVLKLI